jgi:3-oxoacyl-[acyl-carrier-protein] synthase-1
MPDISSEPPVNRKFRRFMGDAALYAYHAAQSAIDEAKLSASLLNSPRTGVIVGSGVGSPFEHFTAMTAFCEKGIEKIPPYTVPRVMGSTTSASLATIFGIQGISYSISSACATSAHCIGHGAELIQMGKQDIIIAGGAEEIRWTIVAPFDAMGALSTRYNDQTASRPYDAGRDGFVMAGGAGILILEDMDHAVKRGATILAELVGYGTCSDGLDMVLPSSEGAARAMRLALAQVEGQIDYINAHATSTTQGDISELHAIHDVFGDNLPLISSTKGLTGHPIGASAAHEAIYSLLMLERNFIVGCANLIDPDPATSGFPILKHSVNQKMNTVMSNSFGFGGTNASLVFQRPTYSSA